MPIVISLENTSSRTYQCFNFPFIIKDNDWSYIVKRAICKIIFHTIKYNITTLNVITACNILFYVFSIKSTTSAKDLCFFDNSSKSASLTNCSLFCSISSLLNPSSFGANQSSIRLLIIAIL